LYVHVPFCPAKCRYCDFYSLVIAPPAAEAFIRAAVAELEHSLEHLQTPARSVFVGGGTPTCLGSELLGALLKTLRPLVNEQTEFTVEANPGTVTPAIINVLRNCGVNRVSLGIQSLIADELALLGRIHSPDEARCALDELRAGGIDNINVDLIYGIPGQTLDSWKSSLDGVLEMSPEHLSCYALSFESGTPLNRDRQAGLLEEMSDELQKACYDTAVGAAAADGLHQYEISNFARPPRQCLHNLTYWRNEPYLGIGPAATSYVTGVRRTNRPDLQAYVRALAQGKIPPSTCERLSARPAMAETLMLALRTVSGVDRGDFAERFGQDPLRAFAKTIRRYEQLGNLAVTPSHIRICPESFFVADTILADLLAEA